MDEARFIAAELARLLGAGHITEPGQAAVLFRTNAQARVIADALRSQGLPVQLRADQDVFARPEIRDLLAYLRLGHNPNDTPALARIIDTPPRGLRIVERAFDANLYLWPTWQSPHMAEVVAPRAGPRGAGVHAG